MSLLHSNPSAVSCQLRFAQTHPKYYCQQAESHAKASEKAGYKVKCRDPRCSIDCRENWARKLSACLAHRLRVVRESEEFSEDIIIVRGNLALPKGSTPADHQRVKAAFLRRINRERTRSGVVIEMAATLHPTDPSEAHWDFVAYSTLTEIQLRRLVSESWHLAGGLHQSVVPIEPSEIEGTTSYQAKVSTTLREPVWLPLPRAQCPLETTWTTGGFWGKLGKEGTWKELIRRWLEDQKKTSEATDSNSSIANIRPSEITDTTPERAFYQSLPPEPSERLRLRVHLAAEHGLTIPQATDLIDQSIRSTLAQRLPRDPSEVITPHQVAYRMGLPVPYVERLLAGLPIITTGDGGGIYLPIPGT